MINFNTFAQYYCGTENKEEQFQILKDSLISIDDYNEISDEELLQLYDKEVAFKQTYEEALDVYDTLIDGKWTCYAIEPLIITKKCQNKNLLKN